MSKRKEEVYRADGLKLTCSRIMNDPASDRLLWIEAKTYDGTGLDVGTTISRMFTDADLDQLIAALQRMRAQ